MPSATLQALSEAPTVLPPSSLTDPQSAEAWFRSLPPQSQAKLKARLTAIVASLPQSAQFDLQRYLATVGLPSPLTMGVGGLGDDAGWGALAAGLLTAGAGLYSASQAARTQQQIAANQASSNLAIQNALLSAQTETNTAIIAAQRDAAIAEQAAKTQRASVYAPTIKWSLLGLGVVALVGGGIFLARRGHR